MQQREGDRVRVRQAAPELAPEVVERHGQVRRGARDVDVDAPTSAEPGDLRSPADQSKRFGPQYFPLAL